MKKLWLLNAVSAVALTATMLGVSPSFAADKVTLTYLADPNWVKAPEKELAKNSKKRPASPSTFSWFHRTNFLTC